MDKNEKPAPDPNNTSNSGHGWIEVLQVLSVLSGGAALILFLSDIGSGFVQIVLGATAVVSPVIALLLLREPDPVLWNDNHRYIITRERLLTLSSVGMPKDVQRAVARMAPFNGNVTALRTGLYELLGESRANRYLSSILPYLRAFDAKKVVADEEAQPSHRESILSQEIV